MSLNLPYLSRTLSFSLSFSRLSVQRDTVNRVAAPDDYITQIGISFLHLADLRQVAVVREREGDGESEREREKGRKGEHIDRHFPFYLRAKRALLIRLVARGAKYPSDRRREIKDNDQRLGGGNYFVCVKFLFLHEKIQMPKYELHERII